MPAGLYRRARGRRHHRRGSFQPWAPVRVDRGMQLAEFAVPPGPGAPAQIRRVIDAVSFLPAAVAADLRLLAALLATSRELVGRGAATSVVWVRIARGGESTRLQMVVARPCGGGHDATALAAAAGPPLLQRMCARWGTARDPHRMTVWFEIDDPVPAANGDPAPALEVAAS